MGICIKCKKTGTSYDLGCGGFLILREKVAELCSKEFGEHYATLALAPMLNTNGSRDSFFEAFDRKTQKLLDEKKVSVKVVDFCLQTDERGKILYGACKEILKHIKDYDDDICYGYAGRPDCFKFHHFKELLQECVSNRSPLVWY